MSNYNLPKFPKLDLLKLKVPKSFDPFDQLRVALKNLKGDKLRVNKEKLVMLSAGIFF